MNILKNVFKNTANPHFMEDSAGFHTVCTVEFTALLKQIRSFDLPPPFR
jgi:hypothetical protein